VRIRVLVVDDDPRVADLVRDGLSREEHSVAAARDADAGLEAAQRLQPDVILLDWNMPGRAGIDVCRALRSGEHTRSLPIIMLTGVDKTSSKVGALDAGADDYVTKPFKPEELAARIRAVLRRLGAGVVPSAVLKAGRLELDGAGYSAKVDGRPVKLTTAEFEILYLLASREGRPLTREILLEHVCPPETQTPRTIDVHVRRIREKLGPDAGAYLKTLHRVGYLFSSRD
jgi:two-component system phosphate regulon response regulator PhoB